MSLTGLVPLNLTEKKQGVNEQSQKRLAESMKPYLPPHQKFINNSIKGQNLITQKQATLSPPPLVTQQSNQNAQNQLDEAISPLYDSKRDEFNANSNGISSSKPANPSGEVSQQQAISQDQSQKKKKKKKASQQHKRTLSINQTGVSSFQNLQQVGDFIAASPYASKNIVSAAAGLISGGSNAPSSKGSGHQQNFGEINPKISLFQEKHNKSKQTIPEETSQKQIVSPEMNSDLERVSEQKDDQQNHENFTVDQNEIIKQLPQIPSLILPSNLKPVHNLQLQKQQQQRYDFDNELQSKMANKVTLNQIQQLMGAAGHHQRKAHSIGGMLRTTDQNSQLQLKASIIQQNNNGTLNVNPQVSLNSEDTSHKILKKIGRVLLKHLKKDDGGQRATQSLGGNGSHMRSASHSVIPPLLGNYALGQITTTTTATQGNIETPSGIRSFNSSTNPNLMAAFNGMSSSTPVIVLNQQTTAQQTVINQPPKMQTNAGSRNHQLKIIQSSASQGGQDAQQYGNRLSGASQQRDDRSTASFVAQQQMDDIRHLYRTYKNIGIKMEGLEFAADSVDSSNNLVQNMLPTIKYSQVQQTTTTILPPLPQQQHQTVAQLSKTLKKQGGAPIMTLQPPHANFLNTITNSSTSSQIQLTPLSKVKLAPQSALSQIDQLQQININSDYFATNQIQEASAAKANQQLDQLNPLLPKGKSRLSLEPIPIERLISRSQSPNQSKDNTQVPPSQVTTSHLEKRERYTDIPKINIETVESDRPSQQSLFHQSLIQFQEQFQKTPLAHFLTMSGFHHINNDFDRPIDRCELDIRVPIAQSDFKNGIFDIAGKVVRQLKYIIKVLSPESEDAIAAAIVQNGDLAAKAEPDIPPISIPATEDQPHSNESKTRINLEQLQTPKNTQQQFDVATLKNLTKVVKSILIKQNSANKEIHSLGMNPAFSISKKDKARSNSPRHHHHNQKIESITTLPLPISEQSTLHPNNNNNGSGGKGIKGVSNQNSQESQERSQIKEILKKIQDFKTAQTPTNPSNHHRHQQNHHYYASVSYNHGNNGSSNNALMLTPYSKQGSNSEASAFDPPLSQHTGNSLAGIMAGGGANAEEFEVIAGQPITELVDEELDQAIRLDDDQQEQSILKRNIESLLIQILRQEDLGQGKEISTPSQFMGFGGSQKRNSGASVTGDFGLQSINSTPSNNGAALLQHQHHLSFQQQQQIIAQQQQLGQQSGQCTEEDPTPSKQMAFHLEEEEKVQDATNRQTSLDRLLVDKKPSNRLTNIFNAPSIQIFGDESGAGTVLSSQGGGTSRENDQKEEQRQNENYNAGNDATMLDMHLFPYLQGSYTDKNSKSGGHNNLQLIHQVQPTDNSISFSQNLPDPSPLLRNIFFNNGSA